MYKYLYMSLRHLYRDLNRYKTDISGSQSYIIRISNTLRSKSIGNRSITIMKRINGSLHIRCDGVRCRYYNAYIHSEYDRMWIPLWNVEFDSVKFMDKLFRNHLKIKCMNDIKVILSS